MDNFNRDGHPTPPASVNPALYISPPLTSHLSSSATQFFAAIATAELLRPQLRSSIPHSKLLSLSSSSLIAKDSVGMRGTLASLPPAPRQNPSSSPYLPRLPSRRLPCLPLPSASHRRAIAGEIHLPFLDLPRCSH
jgi:hypothetical protein